MSSSSLGIPMAHGERGWSTFTDGLVSPQTCRVWVSSSLDHQGVGTDPAQRCGSALQAALQRGVARLRTIPAVQSTSQSRVNAVHHPGYGACKWLFLRQGTSSRHRADVRGDNRNTYPVINPAGLAAACLCLQRLLCRLTARSELVLLCQRW